MGPMLERQDNRTRLTFDAAPTESYAPTVQVTDHPVEKGVSVSDHARPDPLIFTLNCIITESPLSPAGATQGGEVRVLDAIAWLTAAQGQMLDVYTLRRGVLRNVVLSSWSHNFTASRKCEFTLVLREIRVAVAEFVQIPPTQPKTAQQTTLPDTQDTGSQPTTATGTGTGAEDPQADEDTSILYGLGSWLGVL